LRRGGVDTIYIIAYLQKHLQNTKSRAHQNPWIPLFTLEPMVGFEPTTCALRVLYLVAIISYYNIVFFVCAVSVNA